MSWERRSPASAASRRLLNSSDWRTTIRDRFKQARQPCARCNKPIDYDGPYYLPGTRRKNPRYLHVGHIIERDQALALGWTDAEINARSNLQPECAECSSKSGARYGRSKQNIRAVRKPTVWLDTSRDW